MIIFFNTCITKDLYYWKKSTNFENNNTIIINDNTMENKDWKSILGEAFNIDSSTPQEAPEEKQENLSIQEQQGKKVIDIILDRKGRKGKTATIIANLNLDEESIKNLATLLKKECGVGGSSRGEEILLQGDMRDKAFNYIKGLGLKVRII